MYRSRRFAALFLGLSLLVSTTSAALATDPTSGSVTLSDGRVLPRMPSDMLRPSVGAQMLEEHADDSVAVQPGGTPKSLSTAEGSVSTLEDISASTPDGLVAATSAYRGPAGALPNNLRREVLGFLPYWMLDAETRGALRYDLVSTVAYFSIGAQSNGYLLRGTSTNPAIGWTYWNSSVMTDVINKAHARGVLVVPTITMMAWDGDYSGMSQLLNSSTYRTRLVNEIAGTIRNRSADGVNIDFEPVPSSLRSQFTSFVSQLKTGLKHDGVRSYVTVDSSAGAATWATGYDVAGLTASGAADGLMVMGYDLNWSGSSRAGGVAPIDSPYVLSVRDAMGDYVTVPDVNRAKLIWGVPYYGRAWPTTSNALNAPTRTQTSAGYSTAWSYLVGKEFASRYGRKWDSAGQVPWFVYWDAANSTYREGYYDDPTSLRAKYRLVNGVRMGGIGIWSLGMDTGTSDLWNVLYDQFIKRNVRLAGDDRYGTAAAISAASFKSGVPVAYLATGAAFADALAAGPAAAKLAGPVLLTTRDQLPSATAAELSRLKPQRVMVLGGSAVISDAQLRSLGAYTGGSVTRQAGADRYATAAAVSKATFAVGVPIAYVASGATFADGLAGGAAAGKAGGPVLLTTATALPSATRSELTRLKPGKVVVVGGTAVISNSQLAALDAYTTGSVTRRAGADRYATAVAISRAGFAADAPGTVYLATGTAFPDGLAAAAPAARGGVPLLLTRSDGLPSAVADELRRLNPSTVIVLGGSGSVSSAVLDEIRALWD